MLISATHSDTKATLHFESKLKYPETLLKLCVICAPYDRYSNDCRMKAAYFISRYPGELLGPVIPLLIVLLTIPDKDGENMNGNIACHLIKAINKGKPYFNGTIYHDLNALTKTYACGA
jgi:hypothetical protein